MWISKGQVEEMAERILANLAVVLVELEPKVC
jgi:hypothetical protein